MNNPDFLTPLEHLSYIIECSSLGYYGELKGELCKLCECIEKGDKGYEKLEFKSALSKLKKALVSYKESDYTVGASLLSSVSREWWKLILDRYWVSFEVHAESK